jgi:FAD:protein FMN transferase
MDNRKKNIIYSIILLVAIGLVSLYRRSNSPQEPMRIEGATMGTTYHITYFDSQRRDFKSAVDSVLVLVNKSINNYDSTSEVSQFNRSARGVKTNLPYLLPPLYVAKKVYKISRGAFDPTVMPLVNAWGFGPGKRRKLDSTQVDSIKLFIGFDKVDLTKDSVTKANAKIALDFGGIGQGYGADVISDFLRSKGIKNMLVELGGEGMAIGINEKSGKPWEIGILNPNSTYENQFFIGYVSLKDKSFTTSGNYFNYHIEDGVKYSHTIDPFTGYPSQKQILSASIFSRDATTADAWGTALMVLGHEEAIKLLKQNPEIDALILYSGADGKIESYATAGIKPVLRMETENQQQ